MMKTTPSAVLFLFLSGCATWVHETELPETLGAHEVAVGAALGTTPAPQSSEANYPKIDNGHAEEVTTFVGARYGVGDGLEASADVSLLSANLRLRYEWLKPTADGFLSTVSFGGFYAQDSEPFFGDPAPEATDTISSATTSIGGLSLSDSIGKKITPELTLYFGPKAYWINAHGEYTHGASGVTDTLNYSGILYGAFLGAAYDFRFSSRRSITTDIMFTVIRSPKALDDRTGEWMPGVSVAGYFNFL